VQVNITFECGTTTCHSFPGVLCKYLIQVPVENSKPLCSLFEKRLVKQVGVGTLRCDECRNLG
jgi:hypothetical protein